MGAKTWILVYSKMMKALLFFLVLSSVIVSSSHAMTIRNHLSACISVTNTKISTDGYIPVVSFDLGIHKPLAYCGCKSALGNYSVYSSIEDNQFYIIGGKINFLIPEQKRLPLSAEKNLIKEGELIVEFSCAQPD
jgi:hypothetical protein